MTSAPDVANRLYFGDNLDILRQYVADESVDLIYLDPPFNSNATYNVLFRERSGEESAAQITAFEDTWHWGWESEIAFQDVVTRGPDKAGSLLAALRQFLGQNDMMAYLTMMAQRMIELHRVLKPTGSIYLHCDPTASHYLKLLMDAVFDARNFRNEIVWLRTMAKGLMSRQLPNNHDVILGYKKTGESTWNVDATFQPYDEFSLDAKTAAKYSHRDPDGRLYQLDNLLNPNRNRPNLTYEFLGITRVWRWTKERMQAAYDQGLVVQPRPGAVPRLKRYLDEQRGRPFGDVSPAHPGRTSLQSTRRRKSVSATPRRSPRPCWSASSTPAATRATSSLIPSAAAAPPPSPPSGSTAAGSASTSPTWPSPWSATVCTTASAKSYGPTRSSASPPTPAAPPPWPSRTATSSSGGPWAWWTPAPPTTVAVAPTPALTATSTSSTIPAASRNASSSRSRADVSSAI